MARGVSNLEVDSGQAENLAMLQVRDLLGGCEVTGGDHAEQGLQLGMRVESQVVVVPVDVDRGPVARWTAPAPPAWSM